MHPYSSFECNKKYFVDETSILYYKNAWSTIIGDWVDKDLVPKDAITAQEFIWAAPIWHQMKDYQAKSAALIAELEAKSLDAGKLELFDRANGHRRSEGR